MVPTESCGTSDAMPDLISILKFLGVLAGTIFTLHRLYRLYRLYLLWCPIQIFLSVRVIFDESSPNQIVATVTNVSGEDQVLVQCSARSVYPIRTALLWHLQRPLTPPRLYPTIWYAPYSFILMGNEPIRLAPKEPKELSYSLSDHPLQLFVTPQIRVEAQLSEGRTFRSRRIEVPERWQLTPSRDR